MIAVDTNLLVRILVWERLSPTHRQGWQEQWVRNRLAVTGFEPESGIVGERKSVGTSAVFDKEYAAYIKLQTV